MSSSPSETSQRRVRRMVTKVGVAVVAALSLVVACSYILATRPYPRGECQVQLLILTDAVLNKVEEGKLLDESVRELEAAGLSFECHGKPIRINPNRRAWDDSGFEPSETVLVATAVFEGKETILDVEDEPFCYGIDAQRRVYGIPVDDLPAWAR